jgi:hypothetical protein
VIGCVNRAALATSFFEGTRDIYTGDVQLNENGILNKTNPFERLGVSVSHACVPITELLAIKLKGKREDSQCIQVLVPQCHPSFNPNVC